MTYLRGFIQLSMLSKQFQIALLELVACIKSSQKSLALQEKEGISNKESTNEQKNTIHWLALHHGKDLDQ